MSLKSLDTIGEDGKGFWKTFLLEREVSSGRMGRRGRDLENFICDAATPSEDGEDGEGLLKRWFLGGWLRDYISCFAEGEGRRERVR